MDTARSYGANPHLEHVVATAVATNSYLLMRLSTCHDSVLSTIAGVITLLEGDFIVVGTYKQFILTEFVISFQTHYSLQIYKNHKSLQGHQHGREHRLK